VSAPGKGPTDALRYAVFAFRVDQITAEVSTALEAASIPSMLLKGPGIATWLYSGEAPRIYGDTDLLIRKGDWTRALKLMEELGFEDELGPLEQPRMESGEGFPWVRKSDWVAVDLHYTLYGVKAPPEELWTAFTETATTMNVGGKHVSVPSQPARLLHIAMHTVQHEGGGWEKPMKDFELAVEKASLDEWAEARELAERLDALDTFAAGLQLTEPGRDLARAIDATHTPTVHTALRLENVPLSEGFQELKETSGVRDKLRLLFRELFPNRAFMRWWSPLARRGPLGLFLAYCGRPFWLALKAVPGFIAWRKATRQGR
jgi:hypothetical protein